MRYSEVWMNNLISARKNCPESCVECLNEKCVIIVIFWGFRERKTANSLPRSHLQRYYSGQLVIEDSRTSFPSSMNIPYTKVFETFKYVLSSMCLIYQKPIHQDKHWSITIYLKIRTELFTCSIYHRDEKIHAAKLTMGEWTGFLWLVFTNHA